MNKQTRAIVLILTLFPALDSTAFGVYTIKGERKGSGAEQISAGNQKKEYLIAVSMAM